MSIDTLTNFRNTRIEDTDIDSTVDLNNIRINTSDSCHKKTLKFMDDINNPYIFNVDGVIVKVNFNNSGKSFEDALIDCYKTAV